MAEQPTPNQSLAKQINRLAIFIMNEIPGEPSQSEGVVDTAIRWMRRALADQAAQPPSLTNLESLETIFRRLLPEAAVCPECGPFASFDEDGCCAGCGADVALVPFDDALDYLKERQLPQVDAVATYEARISELEARLNAPIVIHGDYVERATYEPLVTAAKEEVAIMERTGHRSARGVLALKAALAALPTVDTGAIRREVAPEYGQVRTKFWNICLGCGIYAELHLPGYQCWRCLNGHP